MTDLVRLLQALSGVAWLLPLAMLTPPLWRVLRGRGDTLDKVRAPHWFVAFVMVAGSGRWLFWSGSLATMGTSELEWWAMIYALNIGAAVAIAAGFPMGERLR
jgi:hypothetical protein